MPAPQQPPPSLSLGDILYVLFRHKWKILALSFLGVCGAAALYLFGPSFYQSEAKLLIKYVVDVKGPADAGADPSKVRVPSERTGENVINTEVEILTSLDLAKRVAEQLPTDVLKKLAPGGTNASMQAAMLINRGIVPDVGKKSDVIHVAFQHKDPEVVQPVLSKLIETYLTRHAEIHQAIGLYDDYLTKRRDEMKSRLAATEEQLRNAKQKAGIISLDDAKKSYADQISRVEQGIFETQSALAESRAEASLLAQYLNTNPVPAGSAPLNTNTAAAALPGTNPVPATNLLAAAGTNPAVPPAAPPVPPEKQSEYKRLLGLLDTLTKKQQELLVQFTPESSMVKGVQAQIDQAEKRKLQLETENPGLLAVKAPETRIISASPVSVGATPAENNPTLRLDLIAQMAKVPGLESRYRVLTNQLEMIRASATRVSENEGAITELQHRRDFEDAQLTYFERNLEQLRSDEQLGAARNSNINPIQLPSPPFKDTKKLKKMVAMVLFGGIGGALALAFLLEFYLDPSLKRPVEVEKMGLPLFLSIPRLHLNGKPHPRSLQYSKTPLLPSGSEPGPVVPSSGSPVVPSLDSSGRPVVPSSRSPVVSQKPSTSPGSLNPQPSTGSGVPNSAFSVLNSSLGSPSLAPFHEALRDRLMTYFELKNMHHKPKLVAVTSCNEGAGVSTVAAGLAASLSETGDGNVLLVDMNFEGGSAHQFYRGSLAYGLDDALELEKRNEAQISENLFVVSEARNSEKLPSILPKRFKNLVPRLKASDYDYIIFDMPPVSQISLTPRLARFMDMVLMVVESEKTGRDLVKRATALLTESQANVGIVMNKSRTYVPKRLVQEL